MSAETDISNNQPSNRQERRLQLVGSDPVTVVDWDLVIRLEYKAESKSTSDANNSNDKEAANAKKKGTSDERNAQIAKLILSSSTSLPWVTALASSSKNPAKTVLNWHLSEYTARNKFDYFVHKEFRLFCLESWMFL